MVESYEYPRKKERELSEEEKAEIRQRILKLEDEDLDQSISHIITNEVEFDCSPSQIAGIKAHM